MNHINVPPIGGGGGGGGGVLLKVLQVELLQNTSSGIWAENS